MHRALRHTEHRPTPLPRRPWIMAMRWLDLAFLHWPVRADRLRSYVPAELEIDCYDGSAWLGVVPFRMAGVRARCLPPLPGSGAFPELNLRTYVRAGGATGVWFFSLDATSRLAVRAARWSFGLPYFDARIACERSGAGVYYRSERTHDKAPPAELRVRWRPGGSFARPARGSLAHWLVERYALFAQSRSGGLRVGPIHHEPWRIAPAECELELCDMTRLIGLELDGAPVQAHAAAPLDVVAWSPKPLDRAP